VSWRKRDVFERTTFANRLLRSGGSSGLPHGSNLRRSVLVAAICVEALLSLASGTAGAAGIVPPQNPSSDLWAVPAYSFTPANDRLYTEGAALPPCWKWGPSNSFVAQAGAPKCVADEIAATDRAQRAEGLPSIALPTNYSALSVPEQLLVLVDIERVSRGEAPVLGLSQAANAVAELGARANTDPMLPANSGVASSIEDWSANYAAGVSALDANYEWMYTDGWDGKLTFNYACTGPTATGCWGHRDNILANASRMPCYEGSCSLIMGAGYVPKGAGNGFSSYTELFVEVSGTVPTLYYTWSEALADGTRV